MPLSRRRITETAPVEPAGRRIARPTVQAYERNRRKLKRSPELLAAVARLDVTIDPAARQELNDWISQHYAEAQAGELVGLFARCHLGHPYVDHWLALTGQIMEHYAAADPVPPEYQACRALVRSPSYIFLEVYSDGQIVPIRADGTAAL